MPKYTLGGDPPQSRAEQILMGEDVIPQSRLEELLLEKNVDPQSRIEDLLNEDHDPGSAVLINKTIMENGTYNAASDNADGYKRVTVNVANTYGASDEGKVVSNGALVSQTAHAEVTQNGTYDTATNNSVTVNVPDGFPTDTASGAIASFPDGADDVPVKSLVAQIVPVQSGSGDPSPDNIRPITGFTGCKVSRTGKNLLSCGMAHGIWSGGVFYSHEGKSTRYLASSAKIPVAGGATYTVSLTNDPTNAWALSNVNFFAQGVFVDYLVVIRTSTFTVPEGIDEIGISGLLETAITNTSDVNPTDIQLEVGSAATAYEPYQGGTYNIAFPSEAGTVYGGTLDVTNGVLTVDSAIVDMGTLNWMYYPNQQRMVAQVNSAKPATANVGLDGACSVYKVVKTSYQLAPDKSIVICNNFISNPYGAMVVYDLDYTDAATFKTAVSGQTLVFPIKNPITYQLTPTEVTTLLGVNNIWADTGDVEVEYYADVDLYVQKKSVTLPQYVNKISSGSFTFASSTVLTTHIPHDLGVTPKFVLCWTDDLESYDSGNGLITGSLTAQSYYRNKTKFYEGYRGAENRSSETEVENLASSIDTLSSILGADYFCFCHEARRYAAGVTYKWIAIA